MNVCRQSCHRGTIASEFVEVRSVERANPARTHPDMRTHPQIQAAFLSSACQVRDGRS